MKLSTRSRDIAKQYDGIDLHPVEWGDVVYAYRIWAGWIFLNENEEKEVKRLWVRHVLYHRQQEEKRAA